MLDKSSLREMDSSVLLKSVSIARRTVSISTTSSEGRQEVRTNLKISFRYVPLATDGFTNIPPNRERVDGLLPAMV
jgi:hypothetical protein